MTQFNRDEDLVRLLRDHRRRRTLLDEGDRFEAKALALIIVGMLCIAGLLWLVVRLAR